MSDCENDSRNCGAAPVVPDIGKSEVSRDLLYPPHYPALRIDSLWNIVESNEAYQRLAEPLGIGRPVVGMHFFELLFAPPFRRYQEACQDWQAATAQALQCFSAQTTPYQRTGHGQHAAYKATIERLSVELSDFRGLWTLARSRPHSRPRTGDGASVCGEGTVFLPWPLTTKTALHLIAYIERVREDRSQPLWMSPYTVTLVPVTAAAAAALTLLTLTGELPKHRTRDASAQLRWGLALTATVAAGLRRENEPRARWDPQVVLEEETRTLERSQSNDLAARLERSLGELISDMSIYMKRDIISVMMSMAKEREYKTLHNLLDTKLLDVERRRDPITEIQSSLDRANDSLSEDENVRYPVQTMEQLKADYAERWVALLPARVGPRYGVDAGRVFAAAAERRTVEEEIKGIKKDHPDLVHCLNPFFVRS